MISSVTKLALSAALLAGLGACADDHAGGYGPGYYGAQAPYYGWYGDYYYPGNGYFVYDRYRVARRWTPVERDYWYGRRGGWHGGPFRDNWRGFHERRWR
jgi:hypothetical protein